MRDVAPLVRRDGGSAIAQMDHRRWIMETIFPAELTKRFVNEASTIRSVRIPDAENRAAICQIGG
jgi:hypothetical protein